MELRGILPENYYSRLRHFLSVYERLRSISGDQGAGSKREAEQSRKRPEKDLRSQGSPNVTGEMENDAPMAGINVKDARMSDSALL